MPQRINSAVGLGSTISTCGFVTKKYIHTKCNTSPVRLVSLTTVKRKES